MPNPPVGTPDWTNGVISGQSVVGILAALASTVVVSLPPNTESVILLCGGLRVGSTVSVVGSTSLVSYPVNAIGSFAGVTNYIAYVPVDSSVDQTIIVSSTLALSVPMYIISDQGIRNVVDIGLAQSTTFPSNVAPATAIQVAGNDGTNLRALITDANGRLIPLVPTSCTSFITIGNAGTSTILAAPVLGANYLFNFTTFFPAGIPVNGNLQIKADNANIEFMPLSNTTLSAVFDMKGRRTTTLVSVSNNTGVTVDISLSYANAPT